MPVARKQSRLGADSFPDRHIGPRGEDLEAMLEVAGVSSLDELVDRAIPGSIRLPEELRLSPAITEAEALQQRVLEARRRVLGKEHPETLRTMGNIGLLYNRQGRNAEAPDLRDPGLGPRVVLVVARDEPHTQRRRKARQGSRVCLELGHRAVDQIPRDRDQVWRE